MNDKWVTMAISAVVFVAVWNLFDYLFATFVSGEGYHFSAFTSILLPAIVGVVVDLVVERGRGKSN